VKPFEYPRKNFLRNLNRGNLTCLRLLWTIRRVMVPGTQVTGYATTRHPWNWMTRAPTVRSYRLSMEESLDKSGHAGL
jgi:hypothetical protein